MRRLLTSLSVSFFLVAGLAGSSTAGPREDEPARSAYKVATAIAKTALTGTKEKAADLNAAIKAANQAQENLPNGSSIIFSPGGHGTVVAVALLPGSKKSLQFNLSTQQFGQFLDVGKDGQFDKLMDVSAPSMLQKLASASQAQPQPNGPIAKLSQMQPLKRHATDNEDVVAKFKRLEEERPGFKTQKPYQAPEFHGKLTDEQKREKASYDIFPRAYLEAAENAKRVQWMVDQEQRAIENEINRSKSLLVPVGGR